MSVQPDSAILAMSQLGCRTYHTPVVVHSDSARRVILGDRGLFADAAEVLDVHSHADALVRPHGAAVVVACGVGLGGPESLRTAEPEAEVVEDW